MEISDRLAIDAGLLTIGQLIQDREAALWEIRRLNAAIAASKQHRTQPLTTKDRESPMEESIPADRLIPIGTVREITRLSSFKPQASQVGTAHNWQ